MKKTTYLVLYRRKAPAVRSVAPSQLTSALQFALERDIWSGQSLLALYLKEHKAKYGITLRYQNWQLAEFSLDLHWLARDYKQLAPKVITTLFRNPKLKWVNGHMNVLVDPVKVAEWVLPVVHFERRRGEQSEWAAPPVSGPAANAPKPPQSFSRIDRL